MIIVGVVVLAILSAWVFIFYLPNYEKINTAENEKQSLLGNLGRKITQHEIDRLSVDLDSLNQNLENREKGIYPVSELYKLGDFFNRTGHDRDLKLVGITPTFGQISQLVVSQEGIISLPMSLEYVGPFSGVTRFIDDFDQLPYIFKIESFKIYIHGEGKSDLDFYMDIQMFFNNTQKVDKTTKSK